MTSKVKRDTLKLNVPKGSSISPEDWDQMANAVEYFMRLYTRYKCIEIASRMNVHGNANETIERAKLFSAYIFDDVEEDE